MELWGSGEAATHALSLAFALLAVPAALWAGRSLFGARAGWIAALLTATLPFLTYHAQETRMYALAALLSLLAAATFVHAFVLRRRRYAAAFAALLALLLYTHAWSLFFAAGALAALVAGRWSPRSGALALAAAGVLFAPWVPTLAFQAARTGAPWASPPPPVALAAAAALAAAGVALRRRAPAAAALALLAGAGLAAAWLAASAQPMWASRYVAVLAGPLLLLAAAAVVRAGRPGVVLAAALALVWAALPPDGRKSNVAAVAAAAAPRLAPGDLVLSTQPEQVPALAYYLPTGLRYATPLGVVADPLVVDWRDALPRLQAARAERLARLVDGLPAGRRLLLVRPVTGDGRWRALWTRLVAARSREWRAAAAGERRLRLVAALGNGPSQTSRTAVEAELFVRVGR